MLYPFMTLEDDTEIVHSDMDEQGRVRVELEKPVEGGFHAAVCTLPAYEWSDVDGFTAEEIARYQKFLEKGAHLILRFARDGGYEHASSFICG